jgi:hypothetical protein
MKKRDNINKKDEHIIPRNHLALAPILRKGGVHKRESSKLRRLREKAQWKKDI